MRIAAPDWAIVSLALVCLAINSVASLLLPKYQGSIIDQVFAKDKAKFQQEALYLLAYSVATGLFGGVRGLCFNVAGRRMGCRVRNELFKGIIIQDIAYFDGTTTGELTSRLSNDANAMINPIQSLLASTLQNLIALVGGLVMWCDTQHRP
jgi:ATP-binding cassette subfamily B protein